MRRAATGSRAPPPPASPVQSLGQGLLQVGGGCWERELDGDAPAVVEDGGQVVSFGGGQDGQLVVRLTCRRHKCCLVSQDRKWEELRRHAPVPRQPHTLPEPQLRAGPMSCAGDRCGVSPVYQGYLLTVRGDQLSGVTVVRLRLTRLVSVTS